MSATDEVVAKPRRADAQRNYDALLKAASRVFAQRGLDASLEDVAKEAGVGIGTLYRNFPSREALVVAAYRTGVEQLTEAARTYLDEYSADKALELWMERFIGYVATKRGLAAVLKTAAETHTELFTYTRSILLGAIDMLLKAAAEAGVVRDDVAPDDLLRAIGGICMVSDQPGWEEQARRLLNLFMDGLRYGAVAR
ncbi:TetR/AcrR family transcriptional regulator [Jatrophihabitans telluris]|uniref:TetR/AcrR family transcriptional regulator n=1 Tax=Jatrophihabitans telluris TaxID=2038343 RepID=A0ABY4R047_9ACTN|nr:TetR/AcrR family transcriptional regulator [Jatrophihabitans telluris]UQX88641.1 TetR/AcrR family transcriptional regulator [Jatrophihabitans telluris]